MRSLFFVFALCAAFVGTTVEGWAGAFGSSILNVSNLRLQYKRVVGGVEMWDNATTTQGAITTQTLSSTSVATLGTVTQFNSATNLNAAMSFVGPSFTTPFTQQAAVPLQSYIGRGLDTSGDFAIADTNGSGVDIISPGGISVSTLAELNTLGPVSAMAVGGLSATNSFSFMAFVDGDYRIAFEAGFSMQTIGDGTGSVGMSITVNGVNPPIAYQPLALNPQSISGNSSVTLSNTFFATPVTSISQFNLVTFNITQFSTVGTAVVPEPSSIAIFGLMSVGSLAALRRRRAGERKSSEA